MPWNLMKFTSFGLNDPDIFCPTTGHTVLCMKHHNFCGSPAGIQAFNLVERDTMFELCVACVQVTSDALYMRKQRLI